MAALEQSLAAAKGSGDGKAAPKRKRSTAAGGNGSKTAPKKKTSGGSRSKATSKK
jgi:hypothetical protein